MEAPNSIDTNRLKLAKQEHLAAFVDQLSPAEQVQLSQQIDAIDFQLIEQLVSDQHASTDWAKLADRAEPPPAARLEDTAQDALERAKARQRGESALRAGEVGMILVAGGQGTRLGFAPPKGMFPIGPISNRTLFQMHCDRLLAVMKRYNVSIPMYVMTSPATDRETREYFQAHAGCGLAEDQLRIFCQGTMPAVNAAGKILMATKGQLALSPDGHGGLVAAMEKNGCFADAKSRGLKYFYYAQVDNPLALLCDPELVGFHILAESQMTTQVVKKRFAKEKVGNVLAIDGKVQIIEYSDLPDAVAEKTDADGSLSLWAGNIAVHVFDRSFLESVVESADGLPFHRAHKKVPFVDANGELQEPTTPNAIKFERFVFDLLPMAERAFVVEGDAAEVFAPVKNADGAETDTPEHSKQAMCNLYRRWLESAGVKVAEGVRVEIHPDWALDAAEVAAKIDRPVEFVADTFLR
jgi:UDP-N-acetylglucosamine/UDP-N-acetylgalactosamine diphosphorylase